MKVRLGSLPWPSCTAVGRLVSLASSTNGTTATNKKAAQQLSDMAPLLQQNLVNIHTVKRDRRSVEEILQDRKKQKLAEANAKEPSD